MRARKNRRRPSKRRPSLPRFTVNWRALLVPPIVLTALGGALISGRALLDRPISELIIDATFQRVSAVQIEAAVGPGLERGFVSLDLRDLKRSVEALDWVDTAQVGRVWPDRVVVRVSEHRAAARWGEDGLLNTRGELFTRSARYAFPELPRLAGPEGSERDVASLYLSIRGRLVEADLALERLSMDARGAVSLLLESGQEVRFGRAHIQDRLERFFTVAAPALSEEFHRVDYIDLRYTNGFAVGWHAATDVASAGAPSSG
jgi:cell division protein FtsQ